MRGKIAWVIASFVIGLSLVIVSCSSGPSATAPTATGPATKAPAATQPAKTDAAKASSAKDSPAAPAAEKPKHGGVLNVFWTNNPVNFDPGKVAHFQVPSNYLTNDELLVGNWAMGPAGSNEVTHIYGANVSLASKVGSLAESWQIVEPGRIVFKIRPGVRFGLNQNSEASKLVNGRELTADDVVFSLNRMIKENNYIRGAAAKMVESTTITAPDKNTVEVKFLPSETLWILSYLAMGTNIVPREVVEKYGDMTDWKNSVGTGPFILTEFVSGSSATFVRNPNYWDKDPVGPGKGSQLPYLDGVKVSIMPDTSTRLAAIRTGKVDWMGGNPPLVKDDFNSLINTTPKLLSSRHLANGTNLVYMRTDKPDLPFKDKKVRHALTMAIDYKTITAELLDGDGEYPGFPTASIPDFKSIYFPLNEAPPAVQELFSYNPTKAKQLLAEAGYPNGFSAEILVDATGGIYTDELAVFKEAWAKIGVDLTLKPMEFAAFNKEAMARTAEQMIYLGSGSHAIYIRMINWDGAAHVNNSYVDDPTAKKAKADMLEAMAKGDQTTADAIYKDFQKYAMEQAWTIPYPRAYNYTVWWPWLKNYHGELNVGFDNGFTWTKWVWLDQDLKKSMLGGQ